MATMTAPRRVVNRKSARPSHGVARLTLTINGVHYRVTPFPITVSVATKLFRLRKADGTHYTVASTLDGLSCDCADYTFRRDRIDPAGCKHIKAMVAVGLLDRKGGAR